MCATFQTLVYNDIKIFGIINGLKIFIVNSVVRNYWFPLISYPQQLYFDEISFS